MFFQVASIFANEIGSDEPIENRMQDVHPAVVARDTFGAILRTDADKIVAAFLEQLDRFYNHRILERIFLEDGPVGRLIECFRGDFDGRLGGFGTDGWRYDCRGAGAGGKADKLSTRKSHITNRVR